MEARQGMHQVAQKSMRTAPGCVLTSGGQPGAPLTMRVSRPSSILTVYSAPSTFLSENGRNFSPVFSKAAAGPTARSSAAAAMAIFRPVVMGVVLVVVFAEIFY